MTQERFEELSEQLNEIAREINDAQGAFVCGVLCRTDEKEEVKEMRAGGFHSDMSLLVLSLQSRIQQEIRKGFIE